MPVKKISKAKKMKKQNTKPVAKTDKEEDIIEPSILKAKKIEIPEEVEGVIEPEEKIDDDAIAEDAEDELGEEVSLDNEELNPFGDKWEE